MKKIITTALITAFFVVFSASAEVSFLRDSALNAASEKPIKRKVESKEGGFDRSYKIQPPMVPHKVEKYKVSLKNNGCLKCHSEKTYEKEKAPKVGDSHFEDRRHGTKSKTISTTRYFCSQCHAVQTNAKVLVENTF